MHMSMSRLRFIYHRLSSQLWVRPTLYSLAALAWVLVASMADYFWPPDWKIAIGKETLINLFTILASTMLTVATFSVSAIAAAYTSVATSATPRATRLVMSDSAVQNTLAAFLATFIFAVVSLTAISAINFEASGRFLLFVGFVFLVGWVLLSFVRWVDRVTRLGRMSDTLARIAEEGRKVFCDPQLSLLGGCNQEGETRPEDGIELTFSTYGYVQHIDMAALQQVAQRIEAKIWLDIRPGKFAEEGEVWGVLTGTRQLDEETRRALNAAVSIGADRDFAMDPRFVLIMLGEVAARALSPAVNDPGTAIRVLALDVELLHLWVKTGRSKAAQAKPQFDRISVPPLDARALVQDAFTPIIRDGAGCLEVGIRLHKTLNSLARGDHPALRSAVQECRDVALEYSDQALVSKAHQKRLHAEARAT